MQEESEAKALRKQAEDERVAREAAEAAKREAEAELQRLRSRSFWQRIFNG